MPPQTWSAPLAGYTGLGSAWGGIVLLLLCCLGTARADGEGDVQQATRQAQDLDGYVQRGNQAVREEKHTVAVQEWALAYLLQPTPEFLFNLAESCRKINRLRDARFYYQRYLQEAPQSTLRSQVAARLTGLSNYPVVRNATAAQLFSEHQDRGVDEYTKQHYQIAMTELALAYAHSPRLALLPNLGKTLQRAGHASEALTVYQRYLQTAPPGPERDRLMPVVAQLTEQLRPPPPPPPPPPSPPVALPASPPPPPPAAGGAQTIDHPALPVASGDSPTPTPPDQRGLSATRPRWSPFFDLRVGFLLGGRKLQFNAATADSSNGCLALRDPVAGRFSAIPCPGYFLPVAAGLHAEVSFFPMAGLSVHALRGLGLMGQMDLVPTSQACSNADDQGNCTAGLLGASELRIEAGIWWRWQLGYSDRRPALSLLAQYGLHRWGFDSPPDATSFRSLPSTTYQYMTVGLAIELPLHVSKNLLIQTGLHAHYHAMLAYGDMTQGAQTDADGGYGPVQSGHGLRVHLTLLEIRPWRGLTLSLAGFYELFLIQFSITQSGQTSPNETRFVAQGLQDQYFGGTFNLGYRI